MKTEKNQCQWFIHDPKKIWKSVLFKDMLDTKASSITIWLSWPLYIVDALLDTETGARITLPSYFKDQTVTQMIPTVVCILVGMKSFPRFWRNHPWCRNKWYLIWTGCFFHWDEAKKNSKWPTQKIQNGRLKKNSFSSSANSQYFFMKFSWIGPWVSRIDWCEGHWYGSTYMAVRLSDICSKTGKKCIFGVFRLFWHLWRTVLWPYRLSQVNALHTY